VADMPSPEGRAARRIEHKSSGRLAWGSCLAASPLAAYYLWQLWDRPHYQFFPLYLAALAALTWRRLSEVSAENQEPHLPDSAANEFGPGNSEPAVSWRLPPAQRAAHISARLLLCGELAALLAAVILFSPWLGYVALLLGLGSLAVRLTGSATGGKLRAVWALAWFLVSPPFGLDLWLVQELQGITALSSSRLLDYFGYRHLLEGNVLEFAGRQLFVEEACSGVQSLFSLTAVVLLFCVWKRRSWPQSILLVAAAMLWALVANTLRVTIIGAIYALTGFDLSSGWPHELMGYVLLALSIVLLLSTDELVVYVFGEIIVPHGRWPRNPLTCCWNRWVANVSPDVFVPVTNTMDDSLPQLSPIAGPRPVLACLFGVLAVLQLVGLAGTAAAALAEVPVPPANFIPAQTLPVSLGAWRCTESSIEVRARSSNEGLYSRIWKYSVSAEGRDEQAPQFTALVSFDYPFAYIHELTKCYTPRGWSIRSRQIESCGWRKGTGEVCAVEMLKADGESAYLLFAEFDRNGRSVRFSPGTTQWVDERLALNPLVQMYREGASRLALESGTLYQFQVFVPVRVPLTEEQKQDIRTQFAALRERLLEEWADGRSVAP